MTKGALALVKWLDRNTGGEYWGGVRCERLGKSNFSMHAEGRAVDWHLDVGDARDRAEAERLLAMLFSPDSDGNANALARRMGIIEAIWDCRYYGFWMTGDASKRYSACENSNGKLRRNVDPTTAHRNHVHFSLSWPGARMRTSYWRYLVAQAAAAGPHRSALPGAQAGPRSRFRRPRSRRPKSRRHPSSPRLRPRRRRAGRTTRGEQDDEPEYWDDY